MSLIVGINFRATSGFVTDGANETYCLGDSDAYPITRGGVTFGWDGSYDLGRDRDAAIDRRLAGVNQKNNNGVKATFRLDLPATGNYTIRLALGDTSNDQGDLRCEVLDDTTSKFTVADADGTLQDHYDDAAGTDRTEAAWPGSNTAQTGVNFATTILKVKLGTSASSVGSSCITHLYVEQEAVAATTTFQNSQSTIIRTNYSVVGY